MNCLCGASINPKWPACLVCKRPLESLDPAEKAAPLTLDLTREDRCQETLAAVKRGDPVNTVRCGDCQHFQRIAHPHMGRCAQGHGRHWLWDTDKRQCEDFKAAVESQP